MADVDVFQCPGIFAKFCGVSMLCVAERCGVVSISCLKLVFCEPNVSLCSVVIFEYDIGLVNDR